MPPLETRNPITAGPEKSNGAEAQDKGFKITIMNMFNELKENMNKYIKEDCENTVDWTSSRRRVLQGNRITKENPHWNKTGHKRLRMSKTSQVSELSPYLSFLLD